MVRRGEERRGDEGNGAGGKGKLNESGSSCDSGLIPPGGRVWCGCGRVWCGVVHAGMEEIEVEVCATWIVREAAIVVGEVSGCLGRGAWRDDDENYTRRTWTM